ncbi:MAG: DJ-1/PfpI family protein [Pseudomonadota bacterium]
MTFSIAFLMFPDLTQLDMTGPAQVLTRIPGARVIYGAVDAGPVPTDCGFDITATTRLKDISAVDMICVPGGFGIVAAMADPAFMDELRRLAGTARFVTSVCTGALVLGAAGLLRGRRATTHWAYHDLLPLAGAIPVRARVVRDGNVFSGGGVTAGIDFGLTIASEVSGEATARQIATALEYAPAPPFGPGDVDAQPDAVATAVRARYVDPVAATRDAMTAALA